MKRITLLLIAALFAWACREAQDTRYFAPDVEFGEAEYATTAENGAVDVLLRFSRPAPVAFRIGLNFSGSLQEGLQFQAPHSLDIAAGATEAKVHIDLVNDEIWDEASWIGIAIAPGSRYTVNPDGNCTARVNVTKEIILPTLRLVSPENPVETNPFRAETLRFEIVADRAPKADVPLTMDFGGLVPGAGCEGPDEIVLPAGKDKVAFELSVPFLDESGCDRHTTLSLVQQKGVYIVASEAGSVDIHLSDPVVDFSPLWGVAALNNGTGYQIRQAIQGPDGVWTGNTAADYYISSEGSNYLRNFRNMYESSWNCLANTAGGNALRLTEFFPNYAYPAEIEILDYGAGSNTRHFSPCDSLMRFVLDPGETKKGDIVLPKPRTFIARTGVYAQWQEDLPGGKAWHLDSKATGGNLAASTHPALTGQLVVKLMRLEGRFDLGDRSQPLLFTAWFQCDSPDFMDGVDPAKFTVTPEDGLWKVSYKLWPR